MSASTLTLMVLVLCGLASWAAPAGPIQYAVSPRGVLSLITGSALWRLPRRVTSTPAR